MPDDPLQPFIDQISEILKFAEKNAGKPFSEKPLDPKIEKAVENLEGVVKGLKEYNEQSLQRVGMNDKKILEKLANPENYTKKEKRLMQNFTDLGLTAIGLRTALEDAKKQLGKSKLRDISANTKKSIQKRRRRLRGAGDKDKWKRL